MTLIQTYIYVMDFIYFFSKLFLFFFCFYTIFCQIYIIEFWRLRLLLYKMSLWPQILYRMPFTGYSRKQNLLCLCVFPLANSFCTWINIRELQFHGMATLPAGVFDVLSALRRHRPYIKSCDTTFDYFPEETAACRW